MSTAFQELILGGCVKYISCLDGEKEVKGCLPGLTFDWKVSNCVPPEANTVTDCQDEGVHREGQSNLEDFLMEEELSTIDTQLHEQCRFKNDGNYISQVSQYLPTIMTFNGKICFNT